MVMQMAITDASGSQGQKKKNIDTPVTRRKSGVTRMHTLSIYWWSSYSGRMVDALAPTGDEGRGKLR